MCELSGSGAVTAVNTFGAAGLLSRHTAQGSTFYTFDERGNVTQRLDATGSPQSTDLYDAYGARVSTATAPPDPFGFGAQDGCYTDAETGLVLCGHRYYDPAAGRFLTRDPAGYAGGLNLYAYCADNPITQDDPSGFNPQNDGGDTTWSQLGDLDTWAQGLDTGRHMALQGFSFGLYHAPQQYQGQPGANVSSGLGNVSANLALTAATLGAGNMLLAARAAAAARTASMAAGAGRAATWGDQWVSASLKDAIERHAGPNATSWITATGKQIFENPATGRQVVVDLEGNYFRIFQPAKIGSMQGGQYLNLMGRLPTYAGGQMTRSLFQAMTHFIAR